MASKPETRLQKRIMDALKAHYGADIWLVNTHGSNMQQRGLPDIMGCLRGRFFGLEVKMPGEEPTDLQRYTLGEITRSGGFARVISSVEEAVLVLASL